MIGEMNKKYYFSNSIGHLMFRIVPMKKLITLLIIIFSLHIKSTCATFVVGSGQAYATPNSLYLADVLNHNDTIMILAQNYSGTSCLANWSKNNLVIKGINGKPHMQVNGENIGGKGIWIISGNNVTVENIEFSGAKVNDKNGAGIRAESNDLTIRNCYFHDNENGILTNNTSAGVITIEHSEFAYNGYGDGYSHNVYVGNNAKLIFQYNYSHHAKVGHNLKSRANENIILYNRIMDEVTGISSRLIDLPNGGFSLVMGNELMQGPLAVNSNMVGYGLEGLTNTLKEFYFINNTLVNKRFSCLFLDIATGTDVSIIQNNLFGGDNLNDAVYIGPVTTISNNVVESDISKLYLENEPNYDYHLTTITPGINGAAVLGSSNGYSLQATKEYHHPRNYINRIIVAGAMDVGAHEFNMPCNATYPSYTFIGGYGIEWSNRNNWDNGCVPPSNFTGFITITTNCRK
jgi:hypothetical protein